MCSEVIPIGVIKGIFGLIAILVSYIKNEILYKMSDVPWKKYGDGLFVIFFVAMLIWIYVWLVTKEPHGEFVETEKLFSSEVYTINVGDAFPLYNSKHESLRQDYVYLGSPDTKKGVLQLVIGKKGLNNSTQDMLVTVSSQKRIQPLEKVQLDKNEYASITFLEKKENAVVVQIDTFLKVFEYEPYDTERNREIKEFEEESKKIERKINSFFNWKKE